nr:hypothetical protein [Tanacetum cinerariifolium]
MNNQQPKPTTPPAITIIPLIITTTSTQMQSPPQNPPKGSSQPNGEHIKKDKEKKAISSKNAKEINGEHVNLTEEEISTQKKIKEGAKVEAARREEKMIQVKSFLSSKPVTYILVNEEKLLKHSLTKKDPLDTLNDLANKKGKHVDDIYDFFNANKRLKSSVQY